MKGNDANDPAFPVGDTGYKGMTLREHFAGEAMKGLLANSEFDWNLAPSWAVQMADRLIDELKKARQ